MPSTVSDLFEGAGLRLSGKVNWGQDFRSNESGVYIVSMSNDANKEANVLPAAPISLEMIKYWLDKISTFELDGQRYPEPEPVKKRLSEFWLPDENILYIGMTTAKLGRRVHQYYTTELGEKRPHAGGHWIKTLSNLDQLYIYYAECSLPDFKEDELMELFIDNISSDTLQMLRDPDHPFPFANLEYPRGNRKLHGIWKSKFK